MYEWIVFNLFEKWTRIMKKKQAQQTRIERSFNWKKFLLKIDEMKNSNDLIYFIYEECTHLYRSKNKTITFVFFLSLLLLFVFIVCAHYVCFARFYRKNCKIDWCLWSLHIRFEILDSIHKIRSLIKGMWLCCTHICKNWIWYRLIVNTNVHNDIWHTYFPCHMSFLFPFNVCSAIAKHLTKKQYGRIEWEP